MQCENASFERLSASLAQNTQFKLTHCASGTIHQIYVVHYTVRTVYSYTIAEYAQPCQYGVTHRCYHEEDPTSLYSTGEILSVVLSAIDVQSGPPPPLYQYCCMLHCCVVWPHRLNLSPLLRALSQLGGSSTRFRGNGLSLLIELDQLDNGAEHDNVYTAVLEENSLLLEIHERDWHDDVDAVKTIGIVFYGSLMMVHCTSHLKTLMEIHRRLMRFMLPFIMK
jgi:hypothetical protein